MKGAIAHLAGSLLDRAGVLGRLGRLASGWTVAGGRLGSVPVPRIRRKRHASYFVLVYHRVDDGRDGFLGAIPTNQFAAQMELLVRTFRVLPLPELVERAAHDEVPPGAVAITFDDGYRDNYTNAWPVLRRLGLPATIFLATGPIDTRAPLWHDRVFFLFGAVRSAGPRPADRMAATEEVLIAGRPLGSTLEHLRTLRSDERDRVIDGLYASARVDPGSMPEAPMLDWGAIAEMAAAGITFGAHTVTHPVLSRIPLSEAVSEISASRERIETKLGIPVRAFAYPNGRRGDFDASVKQALKDAGFQSAVTTICGANDASTDPFELRRSSMWGTSPPGSVFRLLMSQFRMNGLAEGES